MACLSIPVLAGRRFSVCGEAKSGWSVSDLLAHGVDAHQLTPADVTRLRSRKKEQSLDVDMAFGAVACLDNV